MIVLLVTDAEWVRNDVLAGLDRHEVIHLDDPSQISRFVGEADLCIADMQVGSMGGMAIVRAVKDAWLSSGVTPVPIVLLMDRRADEFLAKRAGADAWLLKPFTAQDLRSALSQVTAAAG